MINKQLITRRFSRAIESYNREATAQKQIAGRLNDMLAHYLPARPRHVLEIGSGTGFLTRPLLRTFHPEKLILNDICHEMSTCFADLLSDRQVTFIPGDAEQLSFPSGQDLIVSCSALQWFVSPVRPRIFRVQHVRQREPERDSRRHRKRIALLFFGGAEKVLVHAL